MSEISSTRPVADAPGDRITTDSLVRALAAAPSARALPLAPGSVIDEVYEVRGEIGRGGMGVVYEAYDRDLERVVAVKLHLGEGHPGVLARMRAEARAMARVVHPNVLAVHGVGLWQGRLYIAMEFAPGGSLRRWLGHRRDRDAVLEVMLAAARGLAAAHDAGVVHRDFKPDNVLLDGSGQAKVADFGLARAGDRELQGERVRGEITQAGAGTPAYMAPEQVQGGVADARTDQFAYCVALHEALVGVRPFEPHPRERFVARVEAWSRGEAGPTRTLGAELLAVLRRGLAVRPEQRFDDMHALVHALVHAARAPARRRARRRTAVVGLAGTAVAAVSWSWWPAPDHDDPCATAGDAFTRSWSGDRSAQQEQAFDGLGLPYGRETWDRVRAGLDAYAEAGEAASREVCASDDVASSAAAAACLASGQRALSRLLARFDAPDDDVVRHAVAWVHGLPSLRACRDPALLLLWTPPPDDPASRAELESIEEAIHDVQARVGASEPVTDAEIDALVARATALGHGATTAWALRTQADVRERQGDIPGSIATLRRAFDVAIAGRARREATLAALAIVAMHARYDVDSARVHEWLATARELEVALDDAKIRAALAANEAIDAASRGDQKGAREGFERALTQLRLADPDEPKLGAMSSNLGRLLLRQGDVAGARTAFGDADRQLRRVLGDHHPEVARVMIAYAEADLFASEPAPAREKLRAAERMLAGAAIDKVERWNLVDRLANAEGQLGDAARALEYGREAAELARAIYPAGHDLRVGATANLAVHLRDAGAVDEAERLLRAELEGVADDDAAYAHLRSILADVLITRGDFDDAIREAELAVAANRDAEWASRARYILGDAQRAAGRDRDAIASYEQGFAVHVPGQWRQAYWGKRIDHAALLLATGSRRDEAIATLREAYGFFGAPERADDTREAQVLALLRAEGVSLPAVDDGRAAVP
ncbi:MAG: protein kinase [Deltaproteobacteria bacterium]|nr:protein kinase [Deltaproteobacteria bacterium]MBP7288304.1 protein kinase [Nannocystaceae bacterium]